MKEFFSKFTFGFLMAQLFPGGLLTMSISCLFLVFYSSGTITLDDLISSVRGHWFGSATAWIVFIFLGGGVGMLLHGMNWAVIAWVENGEQVRNGAQPQNRHITDSNWHNHPVWLQLCRAPLHMAWELLGSVRAPNLKAVVLDEKIARMYPEQVVQVTLLQDFYLNFAQFYMHMAYAILFSGVPLLVAASQVVSVAWDLVLFVVWYVLCSLFFVIGRIQFASLCQAETMIASGRRVSRTPRRIR